MNKSQIVILKDNDWIEKQKYAGSIVAKAHNAIYDMIKGMASNLTLLQLNDLAEDIIRKNNCIPTFLNYKGFPSSICASINNELVHGFGNRNIELTNGDIIKIDIGTTFEGAIGDCAVTYVYGKVRDNNIARMLVSCQDALYDAIKVVESGRRLGEIGKSIWDRSKTDGFGVITDFGGHGIDNNKLHSEPFVNNKSSSNDGITMQPGLSIAIEPMFVNGFNAKTRMGSDKWTIFTKDIGCHWEHSITIDNNGDRHIITEHGISARDFV